MARVVVTGLGCVTPLGAEVEGFWRRLCAGERGLSPIDRFDPSGLRNVLGGQVRDWSFTPADFGCATLPDLSTQFLLVALRAALQDAGLQACPSETAMGAVLSTNFGGAGSWEQLCAERRAGEGPQAFAEFRFEAALEYCCQAFGLTGPLSLLSIACASGAGAIGNALDMIRDDRVEVMLAGGHDELSPTPLSGLSTLHTLTADDIRPFSAGRGGTLFGEGAGILVLESLPHALARGARVYCEVLGSWQNNNAFHLTAPDPGGAGMARVLAGALEDAGLPPECLDYINAHGTGTAPHDVAETEAIKTVLGAHAYQTPVSSIKGAIAHLMGAAGAVEAVATVKTIETGCLPPTVNYGPPDPECDLDYVPNQARQAPVRHAATISAGVGGSNACVVFGPPPDLTEALSTVCAAAQLPTVCKGARSRVVITGLAPISAVGIGREDFFAGLHERREGRRAPERLTCATLPLLAECLDFVVEDYLTSAKTYLDRCSELTLAACALALEDAGMDLTQVDPTRRSLCLGTAYGCLDSMLAMTDRVQTKGVRFGSPVIFTHSLSNSPTSLAAIEHDLQGPTSTFCVGDLSAASALEFGCRLIREGRADLVLAGGVEALSLPLLEWLTASEFADVPGEGACLLVLESEAHARERGATIWGELADVWLDCEAARSATSDFSPPPQYGHTFGARLALDVAAALALGDKPETRLVAWQGACLGAGLTLRRLA